MVLRAQILGSCVMTQRTTKQQRKKLLLLMCNTKNKILHWTLLPSGIWLSTVW